MAKLFKPTVFKYEISNLPIPVITLSEGDNSKEVHYILLKHLHLVETKKEELRLKIIEDDYIEMSELSETNLTLSDFGLDDENRTDVKFGIGENPTFVNLMPYDLHLYNGGNLIMTLFSVGTATDTTKIYNSEQVLGFNIFEIEYGSLDSLPKKKENVYYVVHPNIADRIFVNYDRHEDILVTGLPVVNEKGHIIGYEGLSKVRRTPKYWGYSPYIS